MLADQATTESLTSLSLKIKSYFEISVETLGDPYYKRVSLPRVPAYRDLSQDSELKKNCQLSLQPLNQILSAIIPTDITIYLDIDARQSQLRVKSHLRERDYHTLDIYIIFI